MSVHLFHAFGLRSAILRLHPAARSRNSERAEEYDCVPAVAMRNTGVLTHDGGLSYVVDVVLSMLWKSKRRDLKC